jgi:hypothetical protein
MDVTNRKQNQGQMKKSQPASNNAMVNKSLDDTGKVSHISQASSDYARCIANPFNGPISGVPTMPTTLSFKQRAWVRGTFETSASNGFGSISCSPVNTGFNDLSAIIVTTSAYAGLVIPADGAAGSLSLTSNSQYDSTQVGEGGANLQYRPVACGLKIRYIGTELNRGGQKLGFMDPTHNGTSGRTFSDIDGELTSVRFPVSREWTTVLYRVVNTSENQYRTNFNAGSYPDHYMTFVIQAPPGIPLAFEFECSVVMEFQGRNVRGMSPTPHDPVGFAAIDYVTQVSKALNPNSLTGENREGQIVGHMARYMAHGISHVATHAASSVKDHVAKSAASASKGSWWSGVWDAVKSVAPVAMSLLPALI